MFMDWKTELLILFKFTYSYIISIKISARFFFVDVYRFIFKLFEKSKELRIGKTVPIMNKGEGMTV